MIRFATDFSMYDQSAPASGKITGGFNQFYPCLSTKLLEGYTKIYKKKTTFPRTSAVFISGVGLPHEYTLGMVQEY